MAQQGQQCIHELDLAKGKVRSFSADVLQRADELPGQNVQQQLKLFAVECGQIGTLQVQAREHLLGQQQVVQAVRKRHRATSPQIRP